MTVKELIEKLRWFNPDAKVEVVVRNHGYKFSLSFGTSEGCTKANCDEVNFWVDELCAKGEADVNRPSSKTLIGRLIDEESGYIRTGG
jgi:hypothetical protein